MRYFLLYHDFSDLSHRIVFTILLSETNTGDVKIPVIVKIYHLVKFGLFDLTWLSPRAMEKSKFDLTIYFVLSHLQAVNICIPIRRRDIIQ